MRDRSTLTLITAAAKLIVRLDRGAEIERAVDLCSGSDLLWRCSTSRLGLALVDDPSRRSWLERYKGGWQHLLPSAGPAAEVDGVSHPFHGLASFADWAVETVSRDLRRGATAVLGCSLADVELAAHRVIHVSGRSARISVTDTVTNVGSGPAAYTWTSHPTLEMPADGVIDRGLEAPEWLTASADAVSRQRSTRREPHGGWRGRAPGFWEMPAWVGDDAQRHRRHGGQTEWDGTDLPFLTLWTVVDSSRSSMWPEPVRVLAIEPSTSGPPLGLDVALRRKTHRVLRAGETAEHSTTIEYSAGVIMSKADSPGVRTRSCDRTRARRASGDGASLRPDFARGIDPGRPLPHLSSAEAIGGRGDEGNAHQRAQQYREAEGTGALT